MNYRAPWKFSNHSLYLAHGLLLAVLLLAGCAANQPVLNPLADRGALPDTLELTDTPFFPQQAYQCGPAALATVLATSGIDVMPDQLAGKVYLPERQGSLQLELVAASRRYRRLPYRLEPDLPALLAELAAGRPVLVLQNLGFESYPVWHYAVVIGFDVHADSLVLRSGDRERLVMTTRKFMRSWDRAGNWALVILRPGEFPANVNENRYLEAVAALEATNRIVTATSYYRSALERWPASTLALFGLGNCYYLQGRLPEAEQQYRRLLAIQPGDAAARNNLAQSLYDRGCHDAAFAEVEIGLAVAPDTSPIRDSLLEIRGALIDRATIPAAATGCPVAGEFGWR